MTPLHCAYTPCPNDTFLFGALETGRVTAPGLAVTPVLADIETLNQHALQGRYDLTKASAHAWLLAAAHYRPLAVGAAFGLGSGPLLLAAEPGAARRLRRGRLLFPGCHTTAYLLFRLRHPDSDPAGHAFLPYHEIPAALAGGGWDAGVVIHESRTQFRRFGLHLLADLGAWWDESSGGLPVPLGVCLLRRDWDDRQAAVIEGVLRRSLAVAGSGDAAIAALVAARAQEAEAVVAGHLAAFVNGHTESMGEAGRRALGRLAALAANAGWVA